MIFPLLVWPEISSPAQSFMAVTHPISSCFTPLLIFSSFFLSDIFLGTLVLRLENFLWITCRQRPNRTNSRQPTKLIMLDSKKAHHNRSFGSHLPISTDADGVEVRLPIVVFVSDMLIYDIWCQYMMNFIPYNPPLSWKQRNYLQTPVCQQ